MQPTIKLRPLANNCNLLIIGNTQILFSYETPVAAFVPGVGYMKSSTKYSPTTNRHIKSFVAANCVEATQEQIESLLTVDCKFA